MHLINDMRILILGDSLPGQRPAAGQPIEDTWPVRLKSADLALEIWYRAKTKHSSREVLEEFNLFSDSLHFFDAILIQVGIVDCCPRPFPHWFQRIMWTTCNAKIQHLVNKYCYKILRVWKGRPWISADQFRRNLQTLIKSALTKNPNLKIGVITIAPGAHHLVELMPSVNYFIDIYNKILEEVVLENSSQDKVSLINPYLVPDPSTLIIKDGHHLTSECHNRTAQLVGEFLSKCKQRT